MQHCLYFFPEPQGHNSFLPIREEEIFTERGGAKEKGEVFFCKETCGENLLSL